jgi:hypothetical protein
MHGRDRVRSTETVATVDSGDTDRDILIHNIHSTKEVREMRGVKKGYRHAWGYKGIWREVKTKTGTWIGSFRARKTNMVPRKSMGSIKKGNTIKWKIDGTQTARKLNKDEYATELRFRKRFMSLKK